MKTLGVMSGTSADGIDIVLIEDEPLTLLARGYFAFDKALKSRVLAAIQNKPLTASEMAGLDADLGEAYSAAINHFITHNQIDKSSLRAIGLHGQTVAHLPDNAVPNSWQLGHPAWVAAQTGLPVICDFRRTDISHGGQGAPLAPALHEALFKQTGRTIGVLNLGGIANLTLINDNLMGFDVGPANCLLDEWCHQYTGKAYDDKGQWGQAGQVRQPLLEAMLSDPYFRKPAPKSTGREYFNQRWLRAFLTDNPIQPVDVQRTLIELVVQSVLRAVNNCQPSPDLLMVAGGGVHNHFLMACLQQGLKCPVFSTEKQGIGADDIEAMLMAWLAARHCRGLKTDLRSVTGCQKAHVYGIYYGIY
ncbi:anhydro-N-acetylmuramic acid kinase [Marinicella pacifica]|uniref:Anhydro-N-acetylmuramic acid kinase n=1 Tax=Marinicella pacifica TaxID=1171543 RepID=A0A917FQG5_9GAMM|nr:anhydro-N-acetylmuramic acid kinase [Marinicella pacifica]GGF95950.1 anhydro-N-acetylmuramic acid kinase [Marinicella pacifica]